MPAVTGIVALAAAVAVAVALGVWHRRRDGALRPVSVSDRRPADLRPLVPGQTGHRATLLQFSSAFCAPCRATRRTLTEIAEIVPGVTHVEVDAEAHLELVRRLGILKTPTTLVLDSTGREVVRASGAPRKAEVLAALDQAVAS